MTEVKMKVSKNKPAPSVFGTSVIEITSGQTVSLIQMLNGLKFANRTLPPSAIRFIDKNLKKLKALFEKLLAEEKEYRATFPKLSDYTENNAEGFPLFSNGVTEPTEETPLVTAFFKENKLYNIESGEIIKNAPSFKPIFLTPIDEQNYGDKKKEFTEGLDKMEEVKHEVHVVLIEHTFLESNKINIPTQIPNQQTGEPIYMDTEGFYDFLVIDKDSINEN